MVIFLGGSFRDELGSFWAWGRQAASQGGNGQWGRTSKAKIIVFVLSPLVCLTTSCTSLHCAWPAASSPLQAYLGFDFHSASGAKVSSTERKGQYGGRGCRHWPLSSQLDAPSPISTTRSGNGYSSTALGQIGTTSPNCESPENSQCPVLFLGVPPFPRYQKPHKHLDIPFPRFLGL